MKKTMFALASILFLAMVAGPILADTAKPMSTPVAKTMKHKKVRHKGGKKVGKKMKLSTTPTTK